MASDVEMLIRQMAVGHHTDLDRTEDRGELIDNRHTPKLGGVRSGHLLRQEFRKHGRFDKLYGFLPVAE